MPADLFERHRVIDVDTHLTEPPDVWTARVSSKWGDAVPHIERVGNEDVWMAGGNPDEEARTMVVLNAAM